MTHSNVQLDFVAIGPQRTASTWLYEVLSGHPGVCFPRGVKETMFFDQRFGRGWEYYHSHFRHYESHQVRGEVGPTYFHCEAATTRIREACPVCRVIINVRNPITRAHSLFRHHLSKGRVPNNFQLALRQCPEIVESGHYQKHAMRWESAFGAENVLYLVQEDIEQSPSDVWVRVVEFLSLAPTQMPEIAHETVNTATSPRNRIAAKVLSSSATLLRSSRLHGLAEFGKRIGLKTAFQGGGKVSPMTTEHWGDLHRTYESDIRWLEMRLNRSFATWASMRPSQAENVDSGNVR